MLSMVAICKKLKEQALTFEEDNGLRPNDTNINTNITKSDVAKRSVDVIEKIFEVNATLTDEIVNSSISLTDSDIYIDDDNGTWPSTVETMALSSFEQFTNTTDSVDYYDMEGSGSGWNSSELISMTTVSYGDGNWTNASLTTEFINNISDIFFGQLSTYQDAGK